MNSLYDKNYIRKIRKLYRKNIKKEYGIVEENLQRCHIFGIREAKYIELILDLKDIDLLVQVLTSAENTILLTAKQHRMFESNKLNTDHLNLNIKQKILFDCNLKIKSTKYRKKDIQLATMVLNELKNL